MFQTAVFTRKGEAILAKLPLAMRHFTRIAKTSLKAGHTRKIFSKSYKNNPKSDCIYHYPIDLEQQTDVRLLPNQSVHGKYNLISV